jgi:hypothetical protein
MYTFVVVGCERDLALLKFQAQSMKQYLPAGQEILLLVNEKNPYTFFEGFKQFEHLYSRFKLKVKTLKEFDFVSNQAYVDQQILKFAAAELTDNHLLILDCQNFLFKHWNESNYPILDDKIPYRRAEYAMNPQIWEDYNQALGSNVPINIHNMCLSTPIFLSNEIIRNLINVHGGLNSFAKWFYSISKSKSEFALYLQWCEQRLWGMEKYHYLETTNYDWAGPYLRDHPQFNIVFDDYLNQLKTRIDYKGIPKSPLVLREEKVKCVWSSVNHRAWGDMSDEQFDRLTNLLIDVKLDTSCLIEYRKKYIHIPI